MVLRKVVATTGGACGVATGDRAAGEEPDGRPLEVFPVAIGHYDHAGGLDVGAEVSRVVELLADFGAEPQDWDTPMAERGADAVDSRLHAWAGGNTGHDSVLYWVGHGTFDGKSTVLLHARSQPGTGLSPNELARHVAAREGGRYGDGEPWAIVVVDTCRSSSFVDDLSSAVDGRKGPRRLLLVGVSGAGSTNLGVFSATLESVLRRTFAADREIDLWALAGELKRALPGSNVVPKNVENAVLRRRSPVATGAPLDVLAELNAVLAELSEDERRHFLPKAQGAELGEVSWYFEGRHDERRRIASWLHAERAADRDAEQSRMLVVTGRAGSGKSALLGHVLVHSRPELRDVLVRHRLIDAPAPEELPPDGAFDAVLHLTGVSLPEVIQRLATDLHLPAIPAAAPLTEQAELLLARLGAAPRRTILLDALDEATNPRTVAGLVRRLATTARVVVGTRRSTREGPDQPDPDDRDLLDALATEGMLVLPVERDHDAVLRYAQRRLTAAASEDRLAAGIQAGDARVVGAQPGGVHAADAARPAAPPGAIDAAARLIAWSGQEFLYARLAVHEIIARPDLLTRPDELAGLLTGTHRDLFAAAVARLSDRDPAYHPLLCALARTRGRGLPIRDGIWASIAAALAGTPAAGTALAAIAPTPEVEGDRITGLLDAAAPYLALDTEHGQTVYRLAHRTFAEHFTPDDPVSHLTITRHLVTDLSRTPPGQANPYLVTYTSAHAGAAGAAGWQELDTNPTALDHLDLQAVTADAMRTAFGRIPLPANIAGVISARDLLAAADPHDRPGLRQLAAARHTGTRIPLPEAPQPGAWSVLWASVDQEHTHLTLTGHTGGVTAVAGFNGRGGRALLAAGSGDATVRIWDPATGSAQGQPLTGHTGPVQAVAAFTGPGGHTLLATGSDDATVRIWDPATGSAWGPPLTGHTGGVSAVAAFTGPGGHTLLATGSIDATVRIWDPASGSAVGPPLTGHTGGVRAVAAFTGPGGRTLLATGSDDGTVRIWDPTTGTQVGDPLTGHTFWVRAVAAFTGPGGRTLLATGSDDGTVRIWDPTTGTQVGDPLTGHTDWVQAVAAFTGPGGHTLLATGGKATVRIWDPATGSVWGEPLTGHTGEVWAVAAFTGPGGRALLATGSHDETVRIWDPATGATVGQPLTGHTRGVSAVAAFPGPGRHTLLAAAGGGDGSVRIWDPATGAAVGQPLTGHTGEVNAVAAFTGPGGRTLLATGSNDQTVRIWDPATGTAVGQPLTGHAGWVQAVAAFTGPGGRTLLATGGHDATVRIWDVIKRTCLAVLTLHVSITSLAAIADQYLAVGTAAGVAVLDVSEVMLP